MDPMEQEQDRIIPELKQWVDDAKYVLTHPYFTAEQRQTVRQFLAEIGRRGGQNKSERKAAAARINGASRWRKSKNADA